MQEVTYYAADRVLIDKREESYIEQGEPVGTIKMLHKNVSIPTLVASHQFKPVGENPITYVARRRIHYGKEANQVIEPGDEVAEVTPVEPVDRSRLFGMIRNGTAVTKLAADEEEAELVI